MITASDYITANQDSLLLLPLNAISFQFFFLNLIECTIASDGKKLLEKEAELIYLALNLKMHDSFKKLTY